MNKNVIRVGIVLVIIASSLAAADYMFKERPQQIALEKENAAEQPQVPTPPQSMNSSPSSGATATEIMVPVISFSEGTMSSSPAVSRVVKKGVSTKKKSGVDVHATLALLGLAPIKTSEASLLELATQGASVETTVLLLNNDRAALFAWIENDNVKTIFSALKQALQEQFSPNLTDLLDETRTQDAGPPYDILSFTDLAISSEKVIFIRVRNRLYEFHVAENGEDAIVKLMTALEQ